MELFKRGRGRPKKEDSEIETTNTILPIISNETTEDVDFDNVIENTDLESDLNSDRIDNITKIKKYDELVIELEAVKVEYQKILALYMNAKNNKVETKVSSNDDVQKLESGAKGLYKKFQDIATGNNRFRTKYDSVKIQGINGVLDEIRKHFPTINFSK